MFPHTTAYYLASSQATPQSTRGVLVAFGVILLGGMLGYFLVSRAMHKRRARSAADSERDPNHALVLGPAVITGKVAADTEGDAVTVAIEQTGREWKHKGNWYHAWKERGRTVTAKPFYVVRPSGERVRVEADNRVFLIDRLDGVEAKDRTTRVRTATLRAGEPVHIIGTLVRGLDPLKGGCYRDAAPALVLRPPRSGRMLISTEPLGARFAKRAKLHAGLALSAAITLLFTHGLLFLNHHVLYTVGKVVDASVVSSRTWRVWHKPRRSSGYYVYHYEITATDPNDSRRDNLYQEEVSYRFYDDVQRGSETRVPVITSGKLRQIGLEPSQNAAKLGIFILGTLVYAMTCMIILANTLPWYERRRIVDSGSGPLAPRRGRCQLVNFRSTVAELAGPHPTCRFAARSALERVAPFVTVETILPNSCPVAGQRAPRSTGMIHRRRAKVDKLTPSPRSRRGGRGLCRRWGEVGLVLGLGG